MEILQTITGSRLYFWLAALAAGLLLYRLVRVPRLWKGWLLTVLYAAGVTACVWIPQTGMRGLRHVAYIALIWVVSVGIYWLLRFRASPLERLGARAERLLDFLPIHVVDVGNIRTQRLNRSWTAALLKALEPLEGLQRLRLSFAPIADEDLQVIARHRGLISLNLRATAITDAGLAHLRNLKELEILVLNGTSIGDTALGHVAKIRSLKHLEISNTGITDAGLKHLRGARTLKFLLVGTVNDVTPQAVAALKKALPNLEVI